MLNQRLQRLQLQPNACSSKPLCLVLANISRAPVVSRRRTSSQIVCSAGGFGKSNKKKVSTAGGVVIPEDGKRVKKSYLADDTRGSKAADAAPPGFPTDWVDLKFKATDFPLGKTIKPIELATGKTLMLYKFENMLYVSDANSTAYQYPMVDAKLFRDSSGAVAAEVPLDGTVYDLTTGAVLKWCPKDSPMRSLLGALKSAAQPTPLNVYPVHVTKDGAVWTKLI